MTNPLGLPRRRECNGPKSAKFVTPEMEAKADEQTRQELEEDPIEEFSDDVPEYTREYVRKIWVRRRQLRMIAAPIFDD